MLQVATPLRKSAPWPPNMSLVLRLPREMHLCRSCSNVPRLPSFLKMLQKCSRLRTFGKCRNHCACHKQWRLNAQKWSKCSVHLKLWLRNVLFEQLNVQKCYEAEVWTCWLPNVLRNTAACIFWAAQLPKVLRILRNVLRTTAVRNFWSLIRPDLLDISAHRFSEPTFRPSGETNIGKTVFCDFSTFSRTWIFFLILITDSRLYLLWLFLFSDCSHNCCCICP